MADAKRILLVVDLDSTLLGNAATLEQFLEWHAARSHWVRIVYASGHFFESMQRSIRRWDLPDSDALVCGMGTEIRQSASGAPMIEWRDRVAYDWSALRVRLAVTQFDKLELQPDEFQSELKVSYYGHCLSQSCLNEVSAALRNCGVLANLVYSSERDLDIVPKSASKGLAASFLARRWKFANSDVFVSGDSGNDVSMFQQGFRGIVVANAEATLKSCASPQVYFSPCSFAGGVLDGLRYWLAER